MSALVEARNLCKYFSTPKGTLQAVEDISFTLKAGKTLGVVGESGCGKSTLIRTILGLLPATSGSIWFDGEDITHAKGRRRKELRKEMQIIFQDPFSSLDPRMNVREQIEEPLKIANSKMSKTDLDNRLHELMETVGIAPHFESAYPHEMDGGRRQRIGIARALAMAPRFIVCDEPVSALDVSIQAQILNLLQDLQQNLGLTYIFITHNLSVVKHISSEIMVMYLGCMVEYCKTQELFHNPLHPYTKALLSAIPRPTIRNRQKPILLKGEITSPINPRPGCRFASRCPYATDICHTQMPTPDELLPGHTVVCHHCRKINGL